MRARLWLRDETDRLLRLLQSGHPASQIAQLLDRTESSVRYKLCNLGMSSRRIFETDVPEISRAFGEFQSEREFRESSTIDEQFLSASAPELQQKAAENLQKQRVRSEIRALNKDYQGQLLEEEILDEFRRTVFEIPRTINIPPLDPAVFQKPINTNEVAVVVISDSHVGQVVDAREIDAALGYNPAVFLSRLQYFEGEISRIMSAQPVEKLVVLFAGDSVHGRLGHSLEDDLTLPIVTQVDLAIHAFLAFLCRISKLAKIVEVHAVGGNHGRWPGTRKPPTDRRWSQLDTIVYNSLQALCTLAAPNVHFDERLSARRMIDIGDYRVLLLHGDQLRGGNFASTAIQREMQHWLMRHVQNGERPPNLIVLGDKHVSANLPTGLGEALINGSFVGEDCFAQNFAPSRPAQTMFFIRPGVGKTRTHHIRLDTAPVDKMPDAYELKPELLALISSFHRSNTLSQLPSDPEPQPLENPVYEP
jgi:hypothetical protein